MIFFRLPLQKPSPEHGETGEGFKNGEDIKNLNLHAAHYCYYMQLVTPSDAATAVTIDNKI